MEGTNDGKSLNAMTVFNNKEGCMEGEADGVSLGSRSIEREGVKLGKSGNDGYDAVSKLGWVDGSKEGESLCALAAFNTDGCTEGIVDGISLWSWWVV